MANHYKMEGPERVVTDIVAASQTALWRVEGPAGTIAGSATAQLSGNTFTFVVLQTEEPELANVTSSSKFIWRTAYQYGGLGDR